MSRKRQRPAEANGVTTDAKRPLGDVSESINQPTKDDADMTEMNGQKK
jgi:hypothetical protein